MGDSRKKILVIGHRNPDTDSICSAIAYARLKQKLDDTFCYVPLRAGQISEETQFVLDSFQVEPPEYITDVGTQVRDIDIRRTDGISGESSMKEAWQIMRDTMVATLPVTENDQLRGIIAVKDIATSNMDIYDNRILASSETSYQAVADTLDGQVVVGDPSQRIQRGKIMIAAGSVDVVEDFIEDGDMVIVGDRYESQLCVIEMNAGCLITCLSSKISKTITKLAKERGCTVISTPHDTYTAARLVNQSTPIRYFMRTEDLITFRLDELTESVMSRMAKVRHRDFPVLDAQGKYCGMISRRSLLDLELKKVILVDHNEKSQAVEGLEQADVLEIIDHHRLGSMETINPIYFRNQPVGCTATIVYQIYQENGVDIEKATAGLLCGAILSDTLMFRSPTCTPADRAAAERLAEIAGIDVTQFATEMFRAGSNIKDMSTEGIFYQDFKKFSVGGMTFGIGQKNFMVSEELETVKGRLIHFMEKTYPEENVEMLFFMLTSIIDESTDLLFIGERARELLAKAFERAAADNSILLPGVVSRKKQLLPPLMTVIRQEAEAK